MTTYEHVQLIRGRYFKFFVDSRSFMRNNHKLKDNDNSKTYLHTEQPLEARSRSLLSLILC